MSKKKMPLSCVLVALCVWLKFGYTAPGGKKVVLAASIVCALLLPSISFNFVMLDSVDLFDIVNQTRVTNSSFYQPWYSYGSQTHA